HRLTSESRESGSPPGWRWQRAKGSPVRERAASARGKPTWGPSRSSARWMARSVREKPEADNFAAPRCVTPTRRRRESQQAKQQVQPVQPSTGEPADDGPVDADELQIVAGVLFDQANRALRPERAHPVLAKRRDPRVMTPDQRGDLRLPPAIDGASEARVRDQPMAR